MPRTLLWSDEFDAPAGTPPDRRWWRHETGDVGQPNGELQMYTADPRNAGHDGNGCLVIRAERSGDGFASARLITKGLVAFTYGEIECRAALPVGAGLWPAIWALGADIDAVGWPACGEIDVMENVGRDPERVFGTAHCPGRSGRDGISHGTSMRAGDPFHIFTVRWTREAIAWGVDGTDYHRVERRALGDAWVFDHPFYLLLNLAVGGWLGGPVGADTVFPAEFRIDYLRIYSNEDSV